MRDIALGLERVSSTGPLTLQPRSLGINQAAANPNVIHKLVDRRRPTRPHPAHLAQFSCQVSVFGETDIGHRTT